MPERPNLPVAWPRAVMSALGAYPLLGGFVCFLGWAANVPALTDWDGSGVSIQPNTTVAAMACGAAILALACERRRLAFWLAAIATFLGAATLFEWVSGVGLGIDSLLMFGRTWGRVGVVSPGRMGPPGALSWTLLGASILLSSVAGPASRRITAFALSSAAAVISSLSILGYLYGVEPLYTIPRLTIIAIQTSSFILVASLALIIEVRELAPMRWLAEDGAAGVLARRTLPFVLLVPIVIGWLRLFGQERGLYGTAFGTASFVLLLVAALLGLVFWNLRTVEEKERTLASITDGLVTFDREWRYTFVNPAAERYLRRPASEILGRSIWDVFPQAVGGVAYREMHRSVREATPVAYESFNPEVEVWFSCKTYPNPDGLTVYFQDVTARKDVEESLRRVEEGERADLVRLTRLTTLSAQLTAAGATHSPPLEEIVAVAAEITGTDKGSLRILDAATGRLRIVAHRGLGSRFLDHFAENGCAVVCDRAARTHQRVVVEDVAREPALRDTEDLDVLVGEGIRAVQSTPILTRDGRLIGMLSNHFAEPHGPAERELRYLDLLARMAGDLLERAEVEEALRSADQRKTEFLATLSHELRGPLAPLRNMLEVLKWAGPERPDIREQALGTMERQLAHMTRLVGDLLDVSRITQDKIELRAEPVEVASVLGHAIEACRPLLEHSGQRLEVKLPGHPVTVNADPARLVQAFGNVLNNASKFSEPGGRIVLSAEQRNGEVSVSIRDDGMGIPPEKIASIFEMFGQLDRTLERSHGGLGIGLTLARRLVEMHGGTLTAHSDGAGRGSEFVFRLPVHSRTTA